MELGLEIEWKQLGALGFDDGLVLLGDLVLEGANIGIGHLVA